MAAKGRTLSANDLKAAFKKRQFIAYYQPQADINTGEIIRFEAVARWDHPRLGLLTPNLFLDHIRANDKFDAFSKAILERAIEDCAKWNKGRGKIDASVAVNISGSDAANEKFVAHLKSLLKKYKLPAHKLTVEIPELDLVGRNRQDVSIGLLAIKTLGCGVAMEARGPVFHVQDGSVLPLTQLKIGGAAVMRFASAFQDNRIGVVHRRLAWAREQGLDTVAVGAETASGLRALTVLGFDFVQCNYLCEATEYKNVRKLGKQSFAEQIDKAANSMDCVEQGRAYKETLDAHSANDTNTADNENDKGITPYVAPRRFGNQALALKSVDNLDQDDDA